MRKMPELRTAKMSTAHPFLSDMKAIVAGIGPLDTPEMIIVAILVLVLFGAKKFPTFARSLGRSMGEFQRAKEEFERELHRSAENQKPDEPCVPPHSKPEDKLTPLDAIVMLIVIISAAVLLVIGLSRLLGW
jgi:sec-independent protein translocase protein TatA